MDPDEISKNADKERRKQEKQVRESMEEGGEKVKESLDAFSFKVYAKIFPSGFKIILWIFFVAGIGAVFLFLWLLGDFGKWALYAGLGLLGVFILRVLIEQFRKIFTYGTYKNFKKNLPFELVGWEKLGKDRDLLIVQYWAHDSKIEVILMEGTSTENIQRINDALLLFITAANKNFYEGGFGSDGRKKWEFNHVLKATGSADTAVIGEMYRLLHIYLKSIHQKYPVIKEVRVFFGDTINEVKPPIEVV